MEKVKKRCDNCRHHKKSFMEEPCKYCVNRNKWEKNTPQNYINGIIEGFRISLKCAKMCKEMFSTNKQLDIYIEVLRNKIDEMEGEKQK